MFEHVVDVGHLVDLKNDPGETVAPIDAAMFGAINANVLSYDAFQEDYEALGLTGLRFPGGSLAENDLAETGDWLYDPALYETGFHPSHDMEGRASLGDMLAMADAEGVVLSLTVPVERFFGDPEGAAEWMGALMGRLAAFDGQPPITLDIGNEPYSDPAAYGEVIAAMLGVLREARADGLVGVTAGIQVMQDDYGSTDNNRALLDAIRDADPTLLAEIDAVRMHALDLPTRNAAQYEDVRHELPDLLMDAIAEMGGAPELHVSAWAVRADETLPDDWSGPVSAPLAASGALLSLFASLIEMGASRADAWGLAVSEANRTALTYTGEDGERVIAPHAVTLGLMAETVVGLQLVDDGRLDVGTAGPIVQTYTGEGRTVVFLSAGDIDGPLDVSVSLLGLDAAAAWADRVELIDGGAHAGAAHAVREQVTITEDGRLLWTFEEDWETVRIVISEHEGGAHLFGDATGEALSGTAGDDLIEGMGGDDVIRGAEGADRIDGGAGFDTLDLRPYEGAAPLTVHLGNGTAAGDGLDFEISSIEGLIASAGDDDLTASGAGSVIDAKGGHDMIYGRDGADDLTGGGGRDTIRGGGGDDRIKGAGGNDVIRGHGGDDVMSGGGGGDRFILETDHGRDRITDFDLDLDRITLHPAGVGGMSDLSIRDGENGAIVDTGEGTVLLVGIAADDLAEDHFIF